MTAKQANVLQGTLDLLVLKALGRANCTGWVSLAVLSKSRAVRFK